ncbi:CBS domain-containing protein [Fodinicola acaciae]|uniref:CBS domain-containing protein n=1 Tax=Fodinicola acaciae TaxID=2681555 RepID=UPI001C9E5E49|nr:CBS domain-containing protein [Fodinicola acaciae]
MTDNVVSVATRTSYKEIVRLLAGNRINAVPVTADDGRVVGIVSESDLLHKEAAQTTDSPAHHLLRRHNRATTAKAAATRADELMTTPVVTISADDRIANAARLMTVHAIKQLPVVGDDGVLVGIVARRDLLRLFLRPDESVAADVRREVFRRALCVDTAGLRIDVRDGVVTLRGCLERKSLVPDAVALTRRVDGVVDVVNELSYAVNDAHTSRR